MKIQSEDIKFSIITPCFNSEKTIRRTVESVLNQTYKNYEYIIVDGNSNDKTLDIIEEYRKNFGDRLKVISEKDNGIYDAMNKGIKMASGILIGIVNSDDFYECDALENIYKIYNNEKYAIIYGLIRKILNGKEVMVYSKNHEFIERDMITHPSCFITKDTYNDFGMYTMKYRYSADYEFMLRMNKIEKVKFIESYNIITNFSIDGVSSTAKAYLDTLRLKKEYGLLGGFGYYYTVIKTIVAIKFRR